MEFGRECVLCSKSKLTALGVSHPVVMRTLTPQAELVIGDSFRASGVTICARQSVVIEDHVCIGADATIVDTDFHAMDPQKRRYIQSDEPNARSAPVRICSDAFIGGQAIILKGVTVGRCAIIGAGAVVTRDVPDFAIVAGNPARQVGRVPPEAAC